MQQINLYEYLPKPTKLLLDGRSILILYGVFCSMLLLSSLFGLIGRHSDTKRLVIAKASYSLAQHRLQDIANKHPSAEVQMHAPDIAKLGYCKVHFSTYLAALSHALVPGIALTNIVISDQINERVIVIDPKKHIVHQYGILNTPGYGTSNTQQGIDWPYDAKVIGDWTGLTEP